MSSIYSTAVLAILSFISDSNSEILSNFKRAFHYSMIVVSILTVFSFWATGIEYISLRIAAICYITDLESHVDIVKTYFNTGPPFTLLYLSYIIYKIRSIYNFGTPQGSGGATGVNPGGAGLRRKRKARGFL